MLVDEGVSHHDSFATKAVELSRISRSIRRAASATINPYRDTSDTASTLNSLVNTRRFDMNFASHASQDAL